MYKGELTNEVLPKIYIVFENLIGSLTPKDRFSFNLLVKRKKWDQAVELFNLSVNSSQSLMNIRWVHNFRVDVVTFLHKEMVPAIRRLLDSRNLLFGDVIAYKIPELSSYLLIDPSVLAVFDPDPHRYLTWGSKGRYCSLDQLDYLRLL